MRMCFVFVHALDVDFAIYVTWNVEVFFITERPVAWFRPVSFPPFIAEPAEAGSALIYKWADNMRWACLST